MEQFYLTYFEFNNGFKLLGRKNYNDYSKLYHNCNTISKKIGIPIEKYIDICFNNNGKIEANMMYFPTLDNVVETITELEPYLIMNKLKGDYK